MFPKKASSLEFQNVTTCWSSQSALFSDAPRLTIMSHGDKRTGNKAINAVTGASIHSLSSIY